jgi:hypothetical protein
MSSSDIKARPHYPTLPYWMKPRHEQRQPIEQPPKRLPAPRVDGSSAIGGRAFRRDINQVFHSVEAVEARGNHQESPATKGGYRGVARRSSRARNNRLHPSTYRRRFRKFWGSFSGADFYWKSWSTSKNPGGLISKNVGRSNVG